MNRPFPFIRESLDELKQRLGLEKNARRYKRIHLLYLIKSDLVRTRLDAADFLAIDRETVRVWLSKYKETRARLGCFKRVITSNSRLKLIKVFSFIISLRIVFKAIC